MPCGSIPLKGSLGIIKICRFFTFFQYLYYLVEHSVTSLVMYGFPYLFRGFITAISCQSTDF